MRKKGFFIHDKVVTEFDNRYSAYLNSPSFYKGLIEAHQELEANKLEKAKFIFDSLKTNDNYKARFIAKPVIQNHNFNEIESLKQRVKLAALPIDLGAEKIICEELKFIFVVTPKAGSRSILDYFRQDENINSKLCISEKPLNSLLIENPKYNDFFKFSFVRNPYDRALSSYKDKILTTTFEQNDKGERIPINDFISRYGKKYKLRPEMTFTDYVNFLVSEYGSDSIADRHWLSQHIPVTDEKNRLIVDYIGKLETVDEDWSIICDRIKIPYKSLGQKNSTNKKIIGRESINYSPELRKLITLRYKEDFEIFNYSKT